MGATVVRPTSILLASTVAGSIERLCHRYGIPELLGEITVVFVKRLESNQEYTVLLIGCCNNETIYKTGADTFF